MSLKKWKAAAWAAGLVLVLAGGLLGGSAAGGAFSRQDTPPPPPPERADPGSRYQVQDGDTLVGHVTVGQLSEPPTIVDGTLRQAFYPDVGWKVHNDAGEFVGFFVPNYGFMTPAEAEQFRSNPQAFEPTATPAPPDAELPSGHQP